MSESVLSILMPTVPSRSDWFRILFNNVAWQAEECMNVHPTLGMVEIISDHGKNFSDGGLSIGKKRESLVNRATGKYCCFLDDDDWISPMYIETLLRLARHNADIITFRNITKTETYWCLVDMGLHYPNDGANPNFIVRRKPFHICPVRTDFAKLYDFEDVNYGEDATWMEKVLRHCTTEAKTEQILHEYRHGSHSEADKITQYELQSIK
jgi:glycosyltransferase involved in cell wall biosynthesis